MLVCYVRIVESGRMAHKDIVNDNVKQHNGMYIWTEYIAFRCFLYTWSRWLYTRQAPKHEYSHILGTFKILFHVILYVSRTQPCHSDLMRLTRTQKLDSSAHHVVMIDAFCDSEQKCYLELGWTVKGFVYWVSWILYIYMNAFTLSPNESNLR